MPEIFDHFDFGVELVGGDVEIASIFTDGSGEASHDGVFFKNDARNVRLAQLVGSRKSCWTSSYNRNPGIVCTFHISATARLLEGRRIQLWRAKRTSWHPGKTAPYLSHRIS